MVHGDVEIVHLADLPSAMPMLSAAFWQEWGRHDGLSPAEVSAMVATFARRDAMPLALVARIGDEVVGSVGLTRKPVLTRPVPGPWLVSLWVAPVHRGRGLAGALVTAGERAAGRLGVPQVYAITGTAYRVFQRAGWTPVEQFAHAGEDLTLFHRII